MSVLALCVRTTKPVPSELQEDGSQPQLCVYKDISNKHTYLFVKENHSHSQHRDKRKLDFKKTTGNLENTINII